jgi:hypothetical protein
MAKKSKSKLSHYDEAGRARMVDVSAKPASRREATASAFVALSKRVLKALPKNPKGNPLEVARIAGILAAKRTSELIPMCHPLPLTFIDGSPRRRLHRRPHYLRHDQSPRQIHHHRAHPIGKEKRRQKRRVQEKRWKLAG